MGDFGSPPALPAYASPAYLHPAQSQAPHPELRARVYVGNLSFGTDAESLGLAFSHVGEIVECTVSARYYAYINDACRLVVAARTHHWLVRTISQIVIDRDTGRSKGFAFITFTSDQAAAAAIGESNKCRNGVNPLVTVREHACPRPILLCKSNARVPPAFCMNPQN